MNNNDPFIRYLYSLKYENTGTLAALRRACGQRLAESHKCQWFISISTRPDDFLTATLVAQYSSDKIKNDRDWPYEGKGNIGTAWAEYCRKRDPEQDPAVFYRKRQNALDKGDDPPRPPSIHERFRNLLDAELELDGTGEFAHRIRGLIRMLVVEEIPIDVIQLAYDLRGWRAESRFIQKRWARAFYAPASSNSRMEQDTDEPGNSENPDYDFQEQEEDDAD